ncbi:MAG: TIGR01459 family HAD-type hydrolase [Sphingomonadales bacterium]|nr:TIGR01459 family HAD-type hydrolase [Sphingomonadales bacterium]
MTPASPEVPVLAGVGDLAGRFEAVICDVWGVVHDGCRAFPEALDGLTRLRAAGLPVALVSNTPRPHGPILDQLAGLGVDPRYFDELVTAGDVARAALLELSAGRRCYHIGPARDLPLFEGVAAIRVDSIAAADLIVCSGFADEERETAEDYRAYLAPAAAAGLPLYCANPDLGVFEGGKFLPCAGSIAKLYEEMGGAVRYFGKPYPEVYDWTLARLAAHRGKPLLRHRVLAIGDGLATDVAGARAQGMPVVLIASGLHRNELAGTSNKLFAKARPDWICERLRW